MQLNTRQQEAILHAEGPAIVVAGPGSGKTAVLTHRIDHMVRQLSIPPEKIMVITFTRAAAEEMKSRFRAFPGEADAPVFFATFHAAFYRILRRDAGAAGMRVLSHEERFGWLRELLRDERNADTADEPGEDRLLEISGELSAVKEKEEDLSAYQAKSCDPALFRKLAAGYAERLKLSGKVDFEDMLLRTHSLLLEKPEVLALWQERYPYILVDEFQDINRRQYEILKLLAEPKRNLFAVGDDDQSIYRFRGAEPAVMQQFVRDYPEAVRYELFGCYRCSPEIIRAAKRLIDRNRQRFPKELYSLAERGEQPVIRDFPDSAAEKAALAAAVREQRRKGIPYGNMAILCRTNFALAGLKSALARSGIPHHSREAVPDIYRRPESLDLFAYLELASGSMKRSLFLRIMNRPLRYLPRAAVQGDPVEPGKLLAALMERPRQLEAADRMLYQISFLGKLRPYAAVSYIRNEIGYDGWIKEKAGSTDAADAVLETLDMLQEESAAFSSYAEWKAFIEEQKAEERGSRPTGSAAAMSPGENEDAVTLTTMHGAKGLEFDAVFLPDVNEGNIPHRKSTGKDALEEERRLFYVAVTRARRFLWIGWVRKNRAGACEPSRFLREM